MADPDPNAAPAQFTDEQLSARAAEPQDARRVMTQALAEVDKALAPLEIDYGELDLFVQGGYANRTDKVPSFVIESLTFAAGPHAMAAPAVSGRCRAALAGLRDQLLDDTAARSFTEPSGRSPLFGVADAPSPALDAAQGFVEEVWHRLG
jgi:hypothetical protein